MKYSSIWLNGGIILNLTIGFLVFLFIGCQNSQNSDQNLNQNTHGSETISEADTNYYSGSVIMKPEDADAIWLKPHHKDSLGSGVELHIYIDHENHPHAKSSFAKVKLGEGGALPAHRHDKTEEIAYVLSGEGFAINYINDEYIEIPIKEGYVWYNPPGVWHTFKNTGDGPLTLIMAVIPNEPEGLLSFFRKVGAKPGEEPKTFTSEEFKDLAKKHDMTLMSPQVVE